MDNYITWAYLVTIAGATAVTALVTQFIKGIGFIDRIPTRFVSYIVALILLLAAYGFTGVTGIGNYVLCFLNAIVVSLASNGAYDFADKEMLGNKPVDTGGDEDE